MTTEDEHNRRTETLSRDERGQTLQDFILGITLFIGTLAFVFGMFPGFLEPLTAGTDTADRVQADRVADSLIQKQSVGGQQNVLSADGVANVVSKSQSQLRDRYSLPGGASVNITVRNITTGKIVTLSGQKLATDEKSRNQSASSATRVIRVNEANVNKCEPGCRLVVKVW